MKRVAAVYLCLWHRRGIPSWVKSTDFFDPKCERCQQKLREGVVKGTEPLPKARPQAAWNRNIAAGYREAAAKRGA